MNDLKYSHRYINQFQYTNFNIQPIVPYCSGSDFCNILSISLNVFASCANTFKEILNTEQNYVIRTAFVFLCSAPRPTEMTPLNSHSFFPSGTTAPGWVAS